MITKKEAGKVQGSVVYQYTMENANGLKMSFYTYGGVVQSLLVKDRQGIPRDVQFGYDDLDGYLKTPGCYGAAVGRYANRIGGGKFTIDGREYHLTINENGNTLHGGDGFTFRNWQGVREDDGEEPSVTLRLESPDGDNGFPGNLTMDMTYTLTKDNGWKIEYRGTTDQKCPVNMTNHSFFNLSGDGETALDHILWIDADYFTAANEALLPTGELAPVKGTPFDFTSPKAVGRDIGADVPFLKDNNGYDLNYVVNGWDGATKRIASLSSPKTGIQMDVYTDKPGVQLYTANQDGPAPGKGGKHYPAHGGVCLETQLFPDSPNHPEFPGGITSPGEMYHYTTEYRFHL